MKAAFPILSDPTSGEEAPGLAFNTLALARESREAGDTVAVDLVGAGTRWPAEPDQPPQHANGLYNDVRELVTLRTGQRYDAGV
jgi:hypothetical protein